MKKEITFDEFKNETLREFNKFFEWWIEENKKDPNMFPLKMGLGDWWEQFIMWGQG